VSSKLKRVGVVGLGYWGPNLLRVLSERDDVELAWMCDLDAERLARIGRRYPTARQTQKFNDLLADDALEAIMIATPVFTHYHLARSSLQAGKHTFVEKPLAPSTEEADELMRLADEVDRCLMCGHTFLYSPPVRAVGDMLREGVLGDLYFITSSRVNLGLHQRDVSVIWDLGPHDFSILLSWLGELPSSVRASGRAAVVPGIYDVAFVTLEFPSGVLANVELSWLAPSKLRRTVLVGSERMVVYEDGSPESVRVFDHGVVYEDPETFGQYHLSYRTGDITSPRLSSEEPLATQLEAFLSRWDAANRDVADLALARDVVTLLEAADRSLAEGGATVTVSARPFERVR
jgi:predicted dehydrogenase